ncbi:MAG TPA: GtrA family protein [Intrasporangium sp.]|uniref:GtrA family protein n=1 Tax=Intrasporangium sp. TaxID=1925024 RepID=UPI002D78B293|nr:GtrA family protein [Intrasporangium sp.]HET7397162.1 GtrA family protein [Intrasporangium sp.]
MTAVAPRGGLSQQVVRFAGVGLLSTAVHLGLFATLVRAGLASQPANGVALVVATVGNTALNRSWTFGVAGRTRLVVHHGQALLVFAITWLVTTAALAALARLAPGAGVATQTTVVALANALSTVARFVAMRRWIFHGAHGAHGARGDRGDRGDRGARGGRGTA